MSIGAQGKVSLVRGFLFPVLSDSKQMPNAGVCDLPRVMFFLEETSRRHRKV